ncbi:MAG: PAS domain S-box protein [Bacteroidales bacterium]|nr:PAS domain S-box protein [Bacteroidales bacterium]
MTSKKPSYNALKKRIEELEAENNRLKGKYVNEANDWKSNFLNSSSESIFVLDKELNVIFINPKGMELLNKPKDEVIGKHITDIEKDVVSSGRYKRYLDVLRTAEPIVFERSGNHPVFGEQHYMIKSFKLQEGLGIIAYDITDMKEVEVELLAAKEKAEESEKKYKTLVDNSPDVIVLTDLEGRHLYRNNAYFTSLGYDVNEEVDFDGFAKVHPDDAGMVKSLFESLFKMGKQSGEYRVQTKEGNWIYRHNIAALIYNENKKPRMILNIMRDITDKKHDEQELIKAKEKAEESRRIINQISNNLSHVMIYQVKVINETERKFTYLSETVSKFYGCTPDEAMENPNLIYDKIHPDDIGALIITEKESIRNRSEFDVTARVYNQGGSIRWSLFKSRPHNENDPTLWDGIEMDITEQKNTELEITIAKEKAEESDRLKTAFLQNMSHEIRTPMNAIMGFSDLITRNVDDKEQIKRYAYIINQRSSDLLIIINDILDIAKIEAGQMKVKKELVDVYSIFDDLKMTFNLSPLRKQHIEFTYKEQEDIITVYTDKGKLKQILLNLINNAFKYTEKGKIEFGCKIEDHTIIFFVSDTGIGIPSDEKDKIFDRFYQITQSSSGYSTGTGLGLSIVKGLIKILGGSVWVESEEHKGSTFFFSLPYEPDSELDLKMSGVEITEVPQMKDKTVLIVEDDPYSAEYLQNVLKKTGITILLTGLGEEAIKISSENEIDLIMMDIRLPDIDGYDAAKKIRINKPYIKIIAQTAFASTEDQEKAISAGLNDYLSKPIKEHDLFKILQKHLV